ncbi:MAG: phytoene/squalene synthase family protein [Spirochaetia bacterium]|nr:phytoene/squalene synthase family protein [Spirochaetia bacterium]
MKIEEVHYQTFKSGSKTYFNSSRFFPAEVRRDVFYLYAFVRRADNFVDELPQDHDGFYRFCDSYRRALAQTEAPASAPEPVQAEQSGGPSGGPTGDPIIDRFVELHRRRGFDPAWTEAFLGSMEKDLFKKEYNSLQESLEYIYGSAEVIGLYMSKILQLPPEAQHAARMLGRAMQYINFIRDIKEDNGLGRRYLPLTDTALTSLEYDYVKQHIAEFRRFHSAQIGLYMGWQREAERGYRFIPYRYLLPIKTAADMYIWTAKQIERNPMVVYEGQVKPRKLRIILQALYNSVAAPITAGRAGRAALPQGK